jgi:Flp pilus assembly protein TadB
MHSLKGRQSGHERGTRPARRAAGDDRGARKELGEEAEPALIEAFVDRMEQELSKRQRESEQSLRRKREHQKEMVLGAMALSIPLFALAAIFAGLAGVIVVCAALAVIAIATAR